jgi:hypothetical protein
MPMKSPTYDISHGNTVDLPDLLQLSGLVVF